MTVTNGFFVWFLYGGGVGGWVLFLLAAVAANVWMIYDIQKRMLKATGWLMAAILSGLLIVPVILYRFTVNPVLPDPTSPLVSYGEAIFYLGILAGIAPVVIAVGYYVTFQGLVGCMRGHVYDVGLRQCPECATLRGLFPSLFIRRKRPRSLVRKKTSRPLPGKTSPKRRPGSRTAPARATNCAPVKPPSGARRRTTFKSAAIPPLDANTPRSSNKTVILN